MPDGVTGSKSSPATKARTTTIFPAMYCKGIQSRAESSFCSPRKEQVRQALSIMRSFSTYSSLGLPVEPEVCTSRVSAGSNHSERKEKSSCRKLRLSAGIFHSYHFNFPIGVGDAFYQNGLFVFYWCRILSLFQPV